MRLRRLFPYLLSKVVFQKRGGDIYLIRFILVTPPVNVFEACVGVEEAERLRSRLCFANVISLLTILE